MKNINQNNLPFFDMKNANDLYNKLKHDFNLLTADNPNANDYMNFIFTANHLIEWVIFDNNFDRIKVEECKKIFGVISITIDKNKNKKINFDFTENKEFSTLKSLCNRSKHFIINNPKADRDKVKNLGFDFSNTDFNDFSFRGCEYYVKVENKMVEVYSICRKILNDYKNIFED